MTIWSVMKLTTNDEMEQWPKNSNYQVITLSISKHHSLTTMKTSYQEEVISLGTLLGFPSKNIYCPWALTSTPT